MSTAQAAAVTSCTACAAVGGAAAGGAFSSAEVSNQETSSESEQQSDSNKIKAPRLTDEQHLQKLQELFQEKLSDYIPNKGDKKGYGGKLGEKYRYFLPSTRNESATYSLNWWTASYGMYLDFLIDKKEELSPEFSEENVTSAFIDVEEDSHKTLNKVCQRLYKKDESELKEDKLVKNFWKFCTPFGTKPITISQSSQKPYNTNEIGSKDQDSLMSLLDASNDFFWKLKTVEFLDIADGENEEFNDAFFKNYFDQNKDKLNQRDETPQPFKAECEKAYKATAAQSASTAEAPTQEIAKKYCSFFIPLS